MQQLRIEAFTMEHIYETTKELTERLRGEVGAERIAEDDESRSVGANAEREPDVTMDKTSASGYGHHNDAPACHSGRRVPSGGSSSAADNCFMGYLSFNAMR